MKNILKYIGLFVVSASMFSACQEFEDYTTTIGAIQPLAYVTGGVDNVYTTKVTHTPIGSLGEFAVKIPVKINASIHGGCTAKFAIDNDLVATYNTKNGTSFGILPNEHLKLENATIFIEENVQISTDSLKIELTGDFSLLTDKNGYIVPIRMETSGVRSSTQYDVIYVIVNTEKSIIRPIESIDDMIGFPPEATDRSEWIADVTDYKALFDDDINSYMTLANQYNNVMTVDLGKSTMVTGIALKHYRYGGPNISIEYSENGTDYEQAGTPRLDEMVDVDATQYISFYGRIQARYMRLTFNFSNSQTSYRRLFDLNFYMLESDDPAIYAVCGTNNVFVGTISHTPVGSYGAATASFNVRCSHPKQEGYSVNVAVDNSYIDAYNAANKTNYSTLPEGHIKFANNPVTIGASQYKSAAEVSATLFGDFSELKAEGGYLVPLKLSAPNAITSSKSGVVYLVINLDNNNFRENPSVSNIQGTLVSDRSLWSCNAEYGTDLFDGNLNSALLSSVTSTTVNLGSVKSVDAIRLFCKYANYGDYYISEETKFEISTDGTMYTSLGTATMKHQMKANGYQTFVMYEAADMQYVRFTSVKYQYFSGFAEFDIYAN